MRSLRPAPTLWNFVAVLSAAAGLFWLCGFGIAPAGGLLGGPETPEVWELPGEAAPPFEIVSR